MSYIYQGSILFFFRSCGTRNEINGEELLYISLFCEMLNPIGKKKFEKKEKKKQFKVPLPLFGVRLVMSPSWVGD